MLAHGWDSARKGQWAGMKTSTDSSHRPGAISAFFVYKAALFAACFWTWLAVLAMTEGTVTGWHAVASAGAVTTTVVGVVLGVRFASQRDAARRHEEVMRTLVEISWHTFASGSAASESSDRNVRDGDEDVIRLGQDVGPHPRRDSPRSVRG